MNKINERAWAGQLIAWIQEAISHGTTVFQHASNDEGIKMASGRTKFPDILLFTDKISGIVFNGWELKFPDTPADDPALLENALEKAERLRANSFVTWNGSEAIIWKISEEKRLSRLKTYAKEKGIETRDDLAEPTHFRKHEPQLKARLAMILHDLQQLFQNGELREAINISNETIAAIQEAAQFFIPPFKTQIHELKGDDARFRSAFNLWKINENSTLKILESSSRRVELVEPEEILAKFTYYKLIGKIIFYRTLAENLGGKVAKLELSEPENTQRELQHFFRQAQQIDYQAVFENDFTDEIEFNASINKVVFQLVRVFNEFDFRVLPSSVIGHLLENLVPKEEKQKFGQYFTPEPLAFLVAFSAIKNRNFTVIDPTSGTGTFLNSFYQILHFLGKRNHQELLAQIWGNDISHFPAVLSVINLYKQKVDDVANFPRVTRRDFFNLRPEQTLQIPDNRDFAKTNRVEIPVFDAVISNFPFIQQEDIPSEALTNQFKTEFQKTQAAFLEDGGGEFKINERSDYYIYCFYNSLQFLKPDGFLAAITSNAWLGKNYGKQFKKFLLDNFSIRYVFKSNAEHWFKNAQVSTVFITLQKGATDEPTKFVSLNFKLDDQLNRSTAAENLQFIEDLYTQIDHCEQLWQPDEQFPTVFKNSEKTLRVSVVSRQKLEQSLATDENWAIYFVAENPLAVFENQLINPQRAIFTNGRGTRTGQDDMFILSAADVEKRKIEAAVLQPVLQTSRHVTTILHDKKPETFLFVCEKPESELKTECPNAFDWVKKWETERNKTGEPLPQVFQSRRPFWYTLKTEPPAQIFISINPDKKLFFSYSPAPIHLNQRLVAIRTRSEDVAIIAALLNSIVSLLVVEFNGVSRNLGALDLNADFFKTKMRIFDPRLLSEAARTAILAKFEPLSRREIESFDHEFSKKDRREFDALVLQTYGFDPTILPALYELLVETMKNRVEMKNR